MRAALAGVHLHAQTASDWAAQLANPPERRREAMRTLVSMARTFRTLSKETTMTTAFQNFSLLVVIAMPVAVIAAMNAWAYLQGERDTLMLPGVFRYPTSGVALSEGPATVEPAMEAAAEAGMVVDPCERLAA
jgi:hypothetical protein